MKWVLISIVLNMLLAIAVFSCTEHYAVLAFWFMIYINIVIYSLFTKHSDGKIDFLEPYYVVIALFSLYVWTSAFAEVYSNGKFLSILPIYYLCTILGIIGFIVGYRYRQNRNHNMKSIFLFTMNFSFNKFYRILFVFTIIFVILSYQSLINLFNLSNIRSYVEAAALHRMVRTSASGVTEFLQEVSILFILGSLLIRSFVRKKLSIISTILFGIYAVIGIMSGGKSLVIQFVTLLLIYYNYNVKRISLKPIVICFLILLSFSTIINHVRSTTSIPVMAELAVDLYKTDLIYLTPLMNGELTGPPRTLMNVIKDIESEHMDYSFGFTTYIPDLISFIPRIIYPDRPLPGPENYMETFHPGALQQGLGEGYSMLTEGYWAFGLIGVFIGMFLYGIIISVFYEILQRNLDNGVMIFVYALAFFPLITTATRTGLIGALKGTAMVIVPFLFIIYLSRNKMLNGRTFSRK